VEISPETKLIQLYPVYLSSAKPIGHNMINPLILGPLYIQSDDTIHVT